MFSAFINYRLPVFLLTLFLINSAVMAEPVDERPPFDKSGRKGKIFTHVNDWKFITMGQRPMDLDHFLWRSTGSISQDLAYTAHKLEEYGIKGIYLQNNNGRIPLKTALDAFNAAGNGRTVAWFVTRSPWRNNLDHSATRAEKIKAVERGWVRALQKRRSLMFEHPNYDRVDGHPVVVVYHGAALAPSPDIWETAVKNIEEKTGRIIWLSSEHWNRKKMTRWIPYIDGVTQYSSWGLSFLHFDELKEPMHNKWENKIFEANAGPTHQSVIQGSLGHDKGYRTEFMRFTLNYALDMNPDSLHITNFNDIEENSHVAPSYIRWDSLLRLIRERTREFRNAPPAKRKKPDFIISNKIDLILGQMLNIEVLGFRLPKERQQTVTLDLRLCDESGQEIHRFKKREVTYDKMHSELFRVQSADLSTPPPHVVHPVLRYEYENKSAGPFRLRPTRLRIGQTPTDLCWMTPLDAVDPELSVKWAAAKAGTQFDWRSFLRKGAGGDAKSPGERIVAPNCSPVPVYFYRTIAEKTQQGLPTETWLMEDGKRKKGFPPRQRQSGTATWLKRAHVAPFTWYALETFMFKDESFQYADKTLNIKQPHKFWQSRPVIAAREKSDLKTKEVSVPIQPDTEKYAHIPDNPKQKWRSLTYPINEIRDIEISRYRVPFFHYSFDYPTGGMVTDSSGYDHHGWMSDRRTRIGHQADGPFGFNFSQFFGKFDIPIRSSGQLSSTAPERHFTGDKEGYLHFDGENDYVYFHARTDFPYAVTYELVIRPAPNEREMIILSSHPFGNREQKINIGLDAERRLLIESPYKTNEFKALPPQKFHSRRTIPTDQWTHIAVVNNCEHIKAYINGEEIAEKVKAPVWPGYNLKSFLYLGGRKVDGNPFIKGQRRQFKWEARYEGDIREFKVTGCALQPENFINKSK